MVTISWMHLASQRPASGKTWPIWKPGCSGMSMSEHQCCTSALWHTWDLGWIHPPTRAWLQKTECSQASASRGYTGDLCCDFFMKRQAQEEMWQLRSTWHRDRWDSLDLHQLRICTASASPVTLPELSACGLWKTWTPKGQWRGPLTFYWCQLLGYGYTGGEKAERHNYHSVNSVGYLISPGMSLLISVLSNPPGTQGFPRESVCASQWKGKWPLQAAQEHHTASNPSPKWVAWSCYWVILREGHCNTLPAVSSWTWKRSQRFLCFIPIPRKVERGLPSPPHQCSQFGAGT